MISLALWVCPFGATVHDRKYTSFCLRCFTNPVTYFISLVTNVGAAFYIALSKEALKKNAINTVLGHPVEVSVIPFLSVPRVTAREVRDVDEPTDSLGVTRGKQTSLLSILHVEARNWI
jgi:hypothetical protein